MPNGKTHDKITLYTTPVVGILSYVATKSFQLTAIITFTYVFASFMFNGDLDTNSKPYNRWWLFKMIWIPYQLMFTHRSIFTHGIIIGTIVRIIYLGLIPFIILLIKGELGLLSTLDLAVVFPVLIGLELGSAIHTISDKIY